MHDTFPVSPTPTPEEQRLLDQLLDQIQHSSHYKDVYPGLVRRLGLQELGKRGSLREAVKATKNKLHQIGGAYQESHDYHSWLQQLIAVRHKNEEAFRRTSLQLMSNHVSTRERLPILPDFYQQIFSVLPPMHSIIDLACGLNPLALPWMPLEPDATYCAYDIYQHMMDFLQGYLQLIERPGEARALDVVQSSPTRMVDLVLLLKVLPCLEQTEKQASHYLLHTLQARYLVVSYPIQSIGGKQKGMANYYEQHFTSLLATTRWQLVQKITFPSELVFIVNSAS